MLYDKRWDRQRTAQPDAVEVLERARARIDLAWCREGGRDDDGGICPLLAILEPYTHEEFLRGAADEPVNFFRKAIGARCIPDWNEAPGRTKEDVLHAFTVAIGLARQAEARAA